MLFCYRLARIKVGDAAGDAQETHIAASGKLKVGEGLVTYELGLRREDTVPLNLVIIHTSVGNITTSSTRKLPMPSCFYSLRNRFAQLTVIYAS